MRRVYFLMALVLICSACKTKKYARNNREIEKIAKKNTAVFNTYTTQQYIDAFKDISVQEMNQFGIPASITLAQGLLESGTGNSDLAKYANNHFGIKCTTDWNGRSYFKDDDKSNDCFRVYADARESFKDHSKFLQRKRYAFLYQLNKNDYEGWAYGLRQAGYATNPNYPQLLINLIKKYNLDKYDLSESERDKIKREDRVYTQINTNTPKDNGKVDTIKIPSTTGGGKVHTVQQGDTLYNIAKRYNLTVDDLKAINNLPDNTIKLGQTLIVVK